MHRYSQAVIARPSKNIESATSGKVYSAILSLLMEYMSGNSTLSSIEYKFFGLMREYSVKVRIEEIEKKTDNLHPDSAKLL